MKKFAEIQKIIDENYNYEANGFKIGDIYNDKNQNQWSGKILSYAFLNNLNTAETLELFGEHFADVLNNPNSDTHKNIRALIKYTLSGVKFDNDKLLIIKK